MIDKRTIENMRENVKPIISYELITSATPKKTMSQELIYSLGAYRTIFKVKREDEVLRTIDKWKEQQRNG